MASAAGGSELNYDVQVPDSSDSGTKLRCSAFITFPILHLLSMARPMVISKPNLVITSVVSQSE